MYQAVATAVYKRAVEGTVGGFQVPAWGWGLLFFDILVFFPAYILVAYTLSNIYPVLAMIEDPSPPAYEPVSLNEETDSIAEETIPVADEAARVPTANPIAITSSFRSINRTIYGINGWRSNFRGLGAFLIVAFATMVVYGIISAIPFVPRVVASAISAVTLVQLYTAWTHIIISTPSSKGYRQRLLPFKKTFKATAIPTVCYLIALELSQAVPKFLSSVLGMHHWDPSAPAVVPVFDNNDAWKAVIIVLVSLVLSVALVIPTHVVLIRVQASLLPDDEETIVPFDRSFQTTVEPAIVGGAGYVSMKNAWGTFSRASWVRLVKLYLKIFGVSMILLALWTAVVVPEILIMIRFGKRVQ